jgi:hypothetical protein
MNFHRLQAWLRGSGLDPDSIGSVDSDPNSESGSGSRRVKMTRKSRILFLKFKFWSVGWPLLRAEGFFCYLDVLCGGLGIGKLYLVFYPKNNFFSAVIFSSSIFGHSSPGSGLDWIGIRIGIKPKMLDPDPDEMNADPQPWLQYLRHHQNKNITIYTPWRQEREQQ